MRPDIIASYKIRVENLDKFDPEYLAEDARMIKGVRGAAIVDLREANMFALDVRFHGQTEQAVAESVSDRILAIFDRDQALLEVTYELFGQEEPPAGLHWTGRDPFGAITSQHEGDAWVRADYFVHALSFEDLGIQDHNLEHMIIEALQRWPQRNPAREAIRRLREMYAFLEEVRGFANMPTPKVDAAVAEKLAAANEAAERVMADAREKVADTAVVATQS